MRENTSIIVVMLLALIACSNQSSSKDIKKELSAKGEQRDNLGKYAIPARSSDKEIMEILQKEKKAGTLNAKGFSVLGHHYEHEGRYAQAVENYKKAIELDPEYIEVYNALGLAYGHSSLEDKEKLSIETLQKGLELCKRKPGEFDCVVVIQNIASKYLVYKIYPDSEKNMLQVIKYSEEGLRIVDKERNLQDYTRFHYLFGEAYSELPGKENLLKAINAYKEVLKYKSSPWYESAKIRLHFAEQDLRVKYKREPKQDN